MTEAAGVAVKGAAAGAVSAAVMSSTFGIIALCGIIAFEWWQGAKDARQLQAAEEVDAEEKP
jgi:hypothetical protein